MLKVDINIPFYREQSIQINIGPHKSIFRVPTTQYPENQMAIVGLNMVAPKSAICPAESYRSMAAADCFIFFKYNLLFK